MWIKPMVHVPVVGMLVSALAATVFLCPCRHSCPSRAAAATPVTEPRLIVRSHPSGASIWINGQLQDGMLTPAMLEVPPGEVTVRVKLEGHESRMVLINMPAHGGRQDLTVALTPKNP